MNDDQPRDIVGRFDEKAYSQPEVTLPSEMPEGTFLFPPATWPGGVEQYISFWMNAPVSDETLSNLGSAYAANRDAWEEGKLVEWAGWWGNSPDARRLAANMKTKPEDIAAARTAARDEFIAAMEANRPHRIPMAITRDVARAAQVISNLNRLKPDIDTQPARDTPLVTTVTGETLSAQEIWDRYRLAEIMPDALMGSYSLERKLDSLREEISQLRHGV